MNCISDTHNQKLQIVYTFLVQENDSVGDLNPPLLFLKKKNVFQNSMFLLLLYNFGTFLTDMFLKIVLFDIQKPETDNKYSKYEHIF